jgi:hypothetical protein
MAPYSCADSDAVLAALDLELVLRDRTKSAANKIEDIF